MAALAARWGVTLESEKRPSIHFWGQDAVFGGESPRPGSLPYVPTRAFRALLTPSSGVPISVRGHPRGKAS